MNGDLLPDPENPCDEVGHELEEMADQWGHTTFECIRCGEIWVTA